MGKKNIVYGSPFGPPIMLLDKIWRFHSTDTVYNSFLKILIKQHSKQSTCAGSLGSCNSKSTISSKNGFHHPVLSCRSFEQYTGKNTVISHDFLVWKFCGKVQFPHSFGRFAGNYAEIMPFRKISTPGNQVKLRYFLQWNGSILWFNGYVVIEKVLTLIGLGFLKAVFPPGRSIWHSPPTHPLLHISRRTYLISI